MTEHRTFAVSSPTVEVAADESSITHPFAPGTHVRAAHIEIVRRPLFYRAVILAPIPSVADLYAGTIEGRRTTFFAHPELQSFGAEAARRCSCSSEPRSSLNDCSAFRANTCGRYPNDRTRPRGAGPIDPSNARWASWGRQMSKPRASNYARRRTHIERRDGAAEQAEQLQRHHPTDRNWDPHLGERHSRLDRRGDDDPPVAASEMVQIGKERQQMRR
jgi:hypothetical protein